MSGENALKPERGESAIDTLPKLLRDRAGRLGDKEVALRVKDLGIWQEYTWKDYYERVRDLSLGIVNLGLKKGDKVCILGDNKPEWYFAELAVQAVGGIAVGVFTDCIPKEIKYFIEHSDSVFIFAHNQEQVDKVLEIKEGLPYLRKVIYWDPKGMWNYRQPDLLFMEEVMEEGRRLGRERPELFNNLIEQGKPDDIGVICYTSGATGLPKGAMLNQKWLVDGARAWSQIGGWYTKGCEYLSFISPALFTEQVLGIAGSLVAGVKVRFPEEPDTVQENIHETGPELLFYGTRFLENIYRDVKVRMMAATPTRRWIYHRCFRIGFKVADLKMGGDPLGLKVRFFYWIAYHALFRPFRDRLGLTWARWVYSAGTGLSPEIIKFFMALGVEIKLFYGTTETGVISLPLRGEVRPETSGRPVPWVEVKFSKEGEILVKSKLMYSGYYKDPEASIRKFRDGYYHTGDFGYIDKKGYLIVIDRMEDLRSLSGSQKFSSQYIEMRLRCSPYIKDVLVVGGGQHKFATATVIIDLENVGRFAEANHVSYTNFSDLSQKPEVIDFITKEIRQLNKTLPEYARIHRFVNLHRELDPDEAELTRTRKLRRTFVEERYKELINALYSRQDEISIEAPVTYRDGTQGVIRTAIRINQVDSGLAS